MTTKQAYQPKVGDKVRVLVEESQYGTELDMSKPYYVRYERTALGGVAIWEREGERDRVVLTDQIEPWRDPAPSQPQLPQGHVLLRDPSIGDVEREYREVRREPIMGDLVRYKGGRVARIVKRVTSLSKETYLKTAIHHYLTQDCAVLEPTDIVWIYEGDDVYTRYQLAEAGRVAQVGEKALFTGAKHGRVDCALGEVVVIKRQADADHAGRSRAGVELGTWMAPDEYRVLLPAANVESEVAAANHAANVDESHDFTALLATANADMARHLEQARAIGKGEGYAEGFAQGKFDGRAEMDETLTPTISELERQLSIANGQLAKEIEFNAPIRQIAAASGLSVSAVAQHLAEIQRAYAHARDAIVYGTTTPNKTLPTRDEVVEMAKRDYAEIVAEKPSVEIEYVENREARWAYTKVFAVVGGRRRQIGYGYSGFTRGVYNSHIAKVVTLRIALRKSVSHAYLNAPQPEKAQVGDVVFADKEARLVTRGDANPWGTPPTCAVDSFYANAGKLIDDSRDGYVYDIEKYRATQAKGGAAA